MQTSAMSGQFGSPEACTSSYMWAARWMLIILAGTTVLLLAGPVHGLIGLAVVAAPLAFARPKDGLWLSLALIMLASLIARPEGFESGVGYSPELAYWAIATFVLFLALVLRYLRKTRMGTHPRQPAAVRAPVAFYTFVAACVFSAILGLSRGYSVVNVSKQFYGCVLFCGYFLFALKFTPQGKEISSVIERFLRAGLLFGLVYTAWYIYRIPKEGIHKELTILSAYAGGAAVLYLPRIEWKNLGASLRNLIPLFFLIAVPFLTQYKRAILGFVICAFLSLGLRTPQRRRRYLFTLVAFVMFSMFVVTDFLGPIGRSLAKYDSLKMLFPEDIQSSYSVFLRFEETRQILNSIGGVPVFGTGLGSTFSWYDPYAKVTWEQETVDFGWAYLLVKMGIVGTVIFLWFVCQLFRDALHFPLSKLHLAIFLLFIFQLLQMVADPFVFYFMTSAWSGMICGFLYVLNKQQEARLVSHNISESTVFLGPA